MSEEELLAKETFYNLFTLQGVERIEKENELYLIAKKLKVLKKYNENLKKFEKMFKEKMVLEEKSQMPKCKYDIENMNTGKYIVTINGITSSKNDIKFSNIPIFPVERYVNRDTGKEKVKIIYYKDKKWQEKIVDKTQLTINQKLLLLSDYGLDITSEDVRYYTNYFKDMMTLNKLNTLESVSHIGWKDNYFIPYDSHGIFDGVDEFKSIYEAISTKGNYDKWKEVAIELRKKKTMRILMAVVFASPLLEKLGLQPYIVNFWSSLSGNGKTLSCMVAMSIFGNPDVGALRLSSNNTQNYYMTVASFMRNFTCYFDELQIVKKSKFLDLESLVMDLCNGTDKGRLSKASQAKEVRTWYNNFLFTSNDGLVKENAGEQVYNRVIDLEINEVIIKNGFEVARIIKNNYGFAGKEYIRYIQNIGFEKISDRFKEIYNKILAETKATDKQASSLASILLADELAGKCLFNDDKPLQVEDIVEYVNDKDEIKTSILAKEYIKDIINANARKFEENNFNECWGKFREINPDYSVCVMNMQILVRELQKGGFEFNTVKKEWAEMNFLIKNSVNRYIHQTTVNCQKGNYVILDLHF